MKNFILISFVLTASVFFITQSANASTFFASPGDNLSSAFSQLRPGDTLILRDGIYIGQGHRIDCSVGASNGLPNAPITVKAEHERQAWLKGDGSDDTIWVIDCSWWVFRGLRISSADYAPGGDSGKGTAFSLTSNSGKVHDVVFRRNVFHNNNRYTNIHLLAIACWPGCTVGVSQPITNILLEENEFYNFHRHGASFFYVYNSIVRNNYFNSRRVGVIPGGRDNHWSSLAGPTPGDEGYVFYPGRNNIGENNIFEDAQCPGTTSAPSAGSTFNSFYNQVCIGGDGFGVYGYGDNEAAMAIGNHWENSVAIGQIRSGSLWGRSVRNSSFKNMTVLDTVGAGVLLDHHGGGTCCAPYSTSLENILVSGASGPAMQIIEDVAPIAVTLNNSNLFNSGATLFGTIDAGNGFTQTNPNLGSCKVWIPDGSPMKGAGTNGADIGANILYTYENGVLTNKPLWNPQTGEFPHGAIVPGLNDIPGQSLFDIHQRLNVNTNGCPFPQGYGGSWPPGEAVAGGGPAGTVACHLIDSTKTVAQGFGVPWNVLSSARELLLKAFCLPAQAGGETSVTYPVGNGSQSQYIYNQGYYWGGTAWVPFTLSCSNLVSNSWCVGNANFTRNLTSQQLQDTNYYVAYVCNWTGSEWKCGCRDSACTPNFWQLQAFRKP